MCLLWEMPLHIVYIYIIVLIVLLLSCGSSLYTLVINHFQTFELCLPFLNCLFNLLIIYFAARNLFSLVKFHLSIFVSVACASFSIKSSSMCFRVSYLVFNSWNNLSWFSYKIYDKDWILLICPWIFDFSNIICWETLLFLWISDLAIPVNQIRVCFFKFFISYIVFFCFICLSLCICLGCYTFEMHFLKLGNRI